MPESLQPLWRLVIPAFLLLGAYWQLPVIADYIVRYQPLSGLLPYLLCAAAFIIAHIYNRSRILMLTVIVAGSYWLIRTHLQFSLDEPQTFFRYTALGIAMPLNVLLMMVVPEKGLWNKVSLSLLLVPISIGGFIHFYTPDPLFQQWLEHYFVLRPSDGYTLSINSSLVILIAALTAFALHWRNNDETGAASIACIIACYLTLAFFAQALISTTLFTTVGLILIISLLRRSRELAFIDELTGVPGRRAFNERLNNLGKTYSIAMIDIDHFKKFNDRHGHSVGDDVLKMVAARINANSGSGHAYRYGGEEFSIIFNGKTVEQCLPQLEQLRESIAEYLLIIRDNKARKQAEKNNNPKRGASREKSGVNVTISIGIAQREDKEDSPETVLKAADKALYTAKQKGRNRVCS